MSLPDPVPPSGARDRLLAKILTLDDATCSVLESVVAGLSTRCTETVGVGSDIVTPEFAKNFRTRLQFHHATHEEVFKKKTFEFAFKAAMIAAGKKAVLDPDVTSAGYDVQVDQVRYSLKTEASASTSQTYIKISKLMEARWIRECRTGEDYLAGMARVITHLTHYDRVLTLRATNVTSPFKGVRYDLWEIPHEILRGVESIKASDFTERLPSGTSTVMVRWGNQDAFKLRLDGSVEKITLERLPVSLCKKHASWTVEAISNSEEE